MNGKSCAWVFPLVVLYINVSAQQIVRLKNNQPPIICYGENKPGIHTHLSPPEIFQRRSQTGARIKTASIEVDYINFPSQAESAFEYAVSIWESLISSPVTIHVIAVWSDLPSGTLGAAGPSFWVSNFKGSPKFNIYYPGPIAEKLARAHLNEPSEPDIVAEFSSSTNWYFQTTGTPAAGQYDFITVALHELGHGLGFTSTYDVQNSLGSYGEFTGGIPFSFDLSIENGETENLYQTFPSPSTELANQLRSENLYYKTSNTNRIQLYAPASFNDGSSISHLDADTYPQGTPNSLMRPFVNANEVNHSPGPIVRNMFRDLGWVTTYISHDHVEDQENSSQAIPITAIIETDGSEDYSFNASEVYLNYSINGSAFTQIQMLPTANQNEFSIDIPPPGGASVVQYNIQVSDNLDRTLIHPGEYYEPSAPPSQNGPLIAYYSFFVGPDENAPEIVHTPKTFISYLDNELVIDISVKESSELSSVQLEYILNNGTPQISDFTLVSSEPDFFEGTTTYHYREIISFSAGQLRDGDELKYKITAVDNSANFNVGTVPSADYFIVPVEGLAPSRTYYVNDFNSPSDDFIGDEFSVAQPSGFNDPAIHSQHPYVEAGEGNELNFTYQLKVPIIINDQASVMSFDEIVLVEPGENSSAFGDEGFYDYVVVEGSIDGGQSWKPIADGYDSRDNGTWLNQYNSGGDGNATLFRKRTINLLNEFSPDEEVVFRFRLYSDPFGNGWGWAIDNLTIQVDDVPPQISHNHLDYITEDINSLSLQVNATDELLLEKISVELKINDGTSQFQEIELEEQSVFADFTFDIGALSIGDIIYYRFEAIDSAGNISSLPSLGYFTAPKIQFEAAIAQYTNNFNSLATDFVGNFFEIAQPGGFTDGALHSTHPYSEGFGTERKSDFTYTLKKKIIVRQSNPYIRFDEVCIVEDHEDGATFGTSSFNDYVIVEASNDDGVTWKALVDGYDAKDQSDWLNAYDQNQDGSSSLFKTRHINILDTEGISTNDEIIIRFRLFSDELIQSWGWAIDNLHIQDEVTDVEVNSIFSNIVVYPNPVMNDKLSVDFQLRNTTPVIISISSAQGMIIQKTEIKGNPNEKISVPIDVSPYSNGIYLVHISADDKSVVKKIIINR